MKKTYQIQVGQAIRAALSKKGWSQQNLADALGLGKGYISEVISGKKNLTLQTIEAFERALSISLIRVNI